MIVTKRMVSSFEHILKGKLYFFKRRSVPKYLVAAILLGFAKSIDGFGGSASSGFYFVVILLIAFLAIILSAKVQAKAMDFDAEVAFSEEGITLRHRNKNLVEEKDWSWVQHMEIKGDTVWLIPQEQRRLVYQLAKLNSEEIEFFKSKLK